MFLIFLCNEVLAQTKPDSSTVHVEEIVITGGRTASRYSETARSLSIISSEQLKQLPVRSINEALEYVAGVDVRPRGPAGVQADISIRGESFENVLVLIDGIRVNDPQTGHHNLNIPLPMEEVERIEVLRGPAARIHGQNAFSGVINIITKKPGEAGVSVRSAAGDFNYTHHQITVSAPIKNYRQAFSLQRTASKGHRHNTDFGISNFYYRAAVGDEEKRLDLSAGHSGREFGANAFYAEAFPDQWEAVNTTFVRVSSQHNGSWLIKPNLYWRRNTDEFLLRRHSPSFYRNYHVTDVFGGDINASRQWEAGTSSIGAELRREQINSTNLGNRHRYNAGIFAEHRFLFWQRLNVTPGLFAGWYSDYDVRFYPGIDLSYLFRPHISVYATVNKAYRVPTYTELYYNDPANLANPALKPEEAWSFEAGLRITKHLIDVTASVFHKQGYDIIDWVRSSPAQPWQVLNYNQLATGGAEIMLALYPVRNNDRVIIEQLGLQYVALNSSVKLQDLQSKYALDYMRHQAIVRLLHKLPFGAKASWAARYEDRVGYSAYYLVDMRLMRRWQNCNFFVEASNIFNQQYFEISNVTMPGRWVSGGLTWAIQ